MKISKDLVLWQLHPDLVIEILEIYVRLRASDTFSAARFSAASRAWMPEVWLAIVPENFDEIDERTAEDIHCYTLSLRRQFYHVIDSKKAEMLHIHISAIYAITLEITAWLLFIRIVVEEYGFLSYCYWSIDGVPYTCYATLQTNLW